MNSDSNVEKPGTTTATTDENLLRQQLEAEDGQENGGEAPITTMRIRNLPRKYVVGDLLAELCEVVSEESLNFLSVPWEQNNLSNLGFAFVNFVTADIATRARDRLDGQPWQLVDTVKTIRMRPASIQGLRKNIWRSLEALPPGVGKEQQPIIIVGGRKIAFGVAVRVVSEGMQGEHRSSSGAYTEAQDQQESSGPQPITTMMVRNLPRRYLPADLLYELEEVVSEESFNFLSVPWEISNASNLGFGVVNFLTADIATTVRDQMDGRCWKKVQSVKTIRMLPAKIQGLRNNILHSLQARPHWTSEEHNPIVFLAGKRVSFAAAVRAVKGGTVEALRPSGSSSSKEWPPSRQASRRPAAGVNSSTASSGQQTTTTASSGGSSGASGGSSGGSRDGSGSREGGFADSGGSGDSGSGGFAGSEGESDNSGDSDFKTQVESQLRQLQEQLTDLEKQAKELMLKQCLPEFVEPDALPRLMAVWSTILSQNPQLAGATMDTVLIPEPGNPLPPVLWHAAEVSSSGASSSTSSAPYGRQYWNQQQQTYQRMLLQSQGHQQQTMQNHQLLQDIRQQLQQCHQLEQLRTSDERCYPVGTQQPPQLSGSLVLIEDHQQESPTHGSDTSSSSLWSVAFKAEEDHQEPQAEPSIEAEAYQITPGVPNMPLTESNVRSQAYTRCTPGGPYRNDTGFQPPYR